MLIRLICILIIVGVVVWGVSVVLPLLPVPAIFKTIIWVLVVIAAVITIVQSLSGTPNWWKWGGPGPLPPP
jgi:hypothetical protein